MKITLNLEDVWDEDTYLDDALVSSIKFSVIQEMKKNIQDDVDKKVTEIATQVIKDRLTGLIEEKISELIDVGKITVSGKQIPLTEHITNLFSKDHGWSQANQKIEHIAKEFGAELKLQYNNVFANRIVHNLKEQGFLKDELVSILLEDKR